MGSHRSLTAIFRFVLCKRNFCCAFLPLTLLVYTVFDVITMQFQTSVNIYRTMNKTCKGTLELPDGEIRKKISSYRFPGTEKYLEDLFPTFDAPKTMPDFPIFVTALSSNHYQEGLRMIYSLYSMLGERYPYLKLYVYDIGLTRDEQMKFREICNCTFRIFPFDQYPDHVSILQGYAWKPLIIQLIIREYPFIVWLDASIRFTTTNIDPLLNKAKKLKVLSPLSKARVANRTVKDTFEFLKEEPCLFKDVRIFEACVIILYPSACEMKFLLKPWIACALAPGCMVTFDDPKLHLSCASKEYFGCHRFDQSVWSILIHRLYHKHAREHILAFPLTEYMKRCPNCDLHGAKKISKQITTWSKVSIYNNDMSFERVSTSLANEISMVNLCPVKS